MVDSPFQNSTSGLDNYLTVEQIAHNLHVEKETVRGYIRGKQLSAIRLGREYRVPEDSYKQFLTSMHV